MPLDPSHGNGEKNFKLCPWLSALTFDGIAIMSTVWDPKVRSTNLQDDSDRQQSMSEENLDGASAGMHFEGN